MFKTYEYKRLFAAALAVPLLISATGSFAMLEKINYLQTAINQREKSYKNEIRHKVMLNPNQQELLDLKVLKNKVKKLKRHEASIIYKFLTTSPGEYFKATVEEPGFWNRSLVAVKNAVPSIAFGVIGKVLGKFIEPLFKQKETPQETTETGISWSKLSKALSIAKWTAYGLATIYAVRAAGTPFVAMKEHLEFDELEYENSRLQGIPIKEIKFNGDDAPTYVKKQPDVKD